MSGERLILGSGGLSSLSAQVAREWLGGPGARAETLDTCECCGELVDFVDSDAQEREMADQWSAWTESHRPGSATGAGWADDEDELDV